MRFHRMLILFNYVFFQVLFCFLLGNPQYFIFWQKVQKKVQLPKHQMLEKGEILTCAYRTLGEIPPISTISHYPYIWPTAVTGEGFSPLIVTFYWNPRFWQSPGHRENGISISSTQHPPIYSLFLGLWALNLQKRGSRTSTPPRCFHC